MHLKAQADHLLPALRQHAKVATPRGTIPILGHVLLRPGAGEVELVSTDMDCELTTRLPAECECGDPVTVPADRLLAVISAAPKEATVTLRLAGDQLLVSHHAGRSRLPTLPADEWPALSVDTDGPSGVIELAAKVLGGALDRVGVAMSREETRYYLNGVYLEARPDRILVTATDGHRLHHEQLAGVQVEGDPPAVILPRRLVGFLAELGGELRLEVTARLVRAAAGDTRIVSRLIDGHFPDYARVIPDRTPSATRVEIEVAALARAIERVSWASAEKVTPVAAEITAAGILLAAASDGGAAVSEVAATLDGQPLALGFSGRLMLDLLKALPEPVATVQLTGEGAPILVTTEDHPDNRLVLMPMRHTRSAADIAAGLPQ